MRDLRLRLTGGDLALPLVGAAGTVLASYLCVRLGATVGAAAVLAIGLYLGSLVAFLMWPHLAVAGTVALFPLIPALKVFVRPEVGAVKDIVDLAAITAALLLYIFERRRPDRWTGYLVLLLLGLYVVNVGHGHSSAWAQGVRLVGEPLLLLLVGMVLPNPRRNLRYALVALIATGCLVALYGLLQQVLGGARLVSLGYSYDAQVRTIGTRLRSFGTLDDPFAYAMFLLVALAAVVFWLRRGTLAWAIGALLLLGIGASFVRTGILVVIAFTGLLLVRWRYTTAAVFFVVAIAVVAGVSLAGAGGSQTNAYTIATSHGMDQVISGPNGGTANLVLNGRISAWRAALGNDPSQWFLGRGVGKVGTAAARAASGFTPTTSNTASAQAVDSGYLATIADVGLVGLVVLLTLYGRLAALAASAARRGSSAGWVALAMLATLLLDALTRATFTEFPTAFLGMLLIGITLAAAREETESTRAAAATPG